MKKWLQRGRTLISLYKQWRGILKRTRGRAKITPFKTRAIYVYVVLKSMEPAAQELFCRFMPMPDESVPIGDGECGAYYCQDNIIVIVFNNKGNDKDDVQNQLWKIVNYEYSTFYSGAVISFVSYHSIAESLELTDHKMLQHISHRWKQVLVVYDIEKLSGMKTWCQHQCELDPSPIIWKSPIDWSEEPCSKLQNDWLYFSIHCLENETSLKAKFELQKCVIHYANFMKKLHALCQSSSIISECYLTSLEKPFENAKLLSEMTERSGHRKIHFWKGLAAFIFILTSLFSIEIVYAHYAHQVKTLQQSLANTHDMPLSSLFKTENSLQTVVGNTDVGNAYDLRLRNLILSKRIEPILNKKLQLLNSALSHSQKGTLISEFKSSELLSHGKLLHDIDSLCEATKAEQKSCWLTWRALLPDLNDQQFERFKSILALSNEVPWEKLRLKIKKLEPLLYGDTYIDRLEQRLKEKVHMQLAHSHKDIRLWHTGEIIDPLYSPQGQANYFKYLHSQWSQLLLESGKKEISKEKSAQLEKQLETRYWRNYEKAWQLWLKQLHHPHYHSLLEASRDLSINASKPSPYDALFDGLLAVNKIHSFQHWNEMEKLRTTLPELSQCLFKLHRDISKIHLEIDPASASYHYAESIFAGNDKNALVQCVILANEAVYPIRDRALNQMISKFLSENLIEIWSLILKTASPITERPLKTLLNYHQEHLESCFPIEKSTKDCEPYYLLDYYKPSTGLLDIFTLKLFAPFLRPQSGRLVQRQWLGQSFPITATHFQTLLRQKRKQSHLYGMQDSIPTMHFDIRPKPTNGVAIMQFIIDEDHAIYRNGLQTWQAMTWVSDGSAGYAEIRLEDARESTLASLQYQGPWAWLHLLAEAKMTRVSLSEIHLEWTLKGVDGKLYQVAYDLRFNRPFVPVWAA